MVSAHGEADASQTFTCYGSRTVLYNTQDNMTQPHESMRGVLCESTEIKKPSPDEHKSTLRRTGGCRKELITLCRMEVSGTIVYKKVKFKVKV